jgi:SNF2 family DNA or RNA helicase/uncharacterized Zn finger protein
MANKYGATWWGQQWLNSLTNIDNANRLPRGRTYANTGKVRAVSIENNLIEAKVQGSAPRPYKIAIKIPLFTTKEKDALVEEAARNPVLVAKLLNRELPNDMLHFAEKNGIKVFPRTWKDFNMSCSCPDYAVPCKHLAAVIYTVAEEIDRNPFMVFDVHGLDLIKELEKKNIRIGDKNIERIPSVSDFFKAEMGEIKPFKADSNVLKQLDFTQIPDIRADILTLFKPNPLFFPKDFKAILEKSYNGADRFARKILRGDTIPRKIAFSIEPEDRLQLVFDQNLLSHQWLCFDRKDTAKVLKNSQLEDFIQIFNTYDIEALRKTHPTTVALYNVFYFSMYLVKNGAIMPQLLETSKQTYRIRWLPAIINADVKELFNKIQNILPPDLLTIKMGKKEVYQSATEMLNTLCSVFIGKCIAEGAPSDPDSLIKLFNYTHDAPPQYFKDTETPQLIQLWLNNFYLTHKDYVPLLKVEDKEDEGVFEIELMVENRRETLKEPIPLAHIFKKKAFDTVKYDVLKDVMLLSEYFPQLNRIVESQGERQLSFNNNEFLPVLLKILPAINLFGIKILLPKGLKHLVRPQASLLAKKTASKNADGSFLNFEDLVSFDWQVALGDTFVSVQEFQKLVKGLKGIIKLKDQYIVIEEDELRKLYKNLENPPKLQGFDVLKTLLAEEYNGVKIGLTPEAAAAIRQFVQPTTVPLPVGLKATMRPYQVAGYEWMMKNTRLNFGSLIADDMGLGKTLQVIALLLKYKEEGMFEKKKALVVVPTSLLTNWRKEIEKFAPDLRATIYHGQKRVFDVTDVDVVITTYGTIRNEQDTLKKVKWYCTVIDEAQNIKNPDTEQTKTVKALKSDIRIAMSGTPVENRLTEFWSILDYTNKGYLGNIKNFNDTFTKPIQRDHNRQQADLFRKITAPFSLRRLKTDKTIISDLPDKIENNNYATLTPAQAAIYQNVVEQSMKIIYEEGENIKRQGLVLKMITALKQICNHPYQFLKKGKKDLDLSGKAAMLMDLLDNIYENGEKTLIFTQYHEMGDLLQQFITDKYGVEPLFLHGGSSRPQRDAMVDAFQNDPSVSTFILSLKAGGTGLNLTAASNVIHYDLWWNPAVEAQATDRAYRIGQQKNVMVYRLITQGTFEEKIDEMIKMKKDLANMTVAVGENWIGNMTNEDLKSLMSLS